ncbi:hypothetical protein FB451DRAFT_563883 [Mycena latifolia]|nr:hypothetical protein FB451DRAFT_563883 [Mycena latifolia]
MTFSIPLASPPSSPLLSPGTSSPTKPEPTTALKRAESSASQVRTRSQSRARSSHPHKDDIDGSIPRLDLAEMTRGRSVHKNTRARSSVPKRSASVGQPESSTSSTKVEPDSAERRKSNPRLASPSSAGRRSMPEGAPGARRSLTKHPTFLMEHTPLSRSPEPVPRSTRKRKRKSLSSDGEDLNPISDSMHDAPASAFESPLASTSKNKIRSSSVSAKLESKRVMDKGASRSEADSEPESDSVHASSHRRPPPPMSAFPPYFSPPGSFYPYPAYAPGTDIHPTMPLQDLRAQFIISQAMHQLSTLYAAPWSAAQPFTPPRRSSASSGTSPHSYPTTPHHPHTHPYVFDSGASRGTLPPSSPPGSSPSSLASSPIHGAGRRSSLVPRSRSRGRRVSFWLDEESRVGDIEAQEGSSDLPTARGRARHETRTHEVLDDDRASSSTTKPKQKDKGKEKMVNPSDSEGSDAGSQPRLDTRPRLAERAQTPGPPVTRADVETSRTIAPDSTQRRSAGQSSSTTHRPKGKTRKPI